MDPIAVEPTGKGKEAEPDLETGLLTISAEPHKKVSTPLEKWGLRLWLVIAACLVILFLTYLVYAIVGAVQLA
jgi:hypothetical protein